MKDFDDDEIEIGIEEIEFRMIMGNSMVHLDKLLENIFCTCDSNNNRLINYRIYLNDLNDVVLKGSCSACQSPAARYIETGEDKVSSKVAGRIWKKRAN
ncbi:MAG: hypothetical protein WC121_13685 [Candidatus Kapaibacterium sp.]